MGDKYVRCPECGEMSCNGPCGVCNPRNGVRIVDPTPEEIKERCLDIQQEWSEDERCYRRGGYLNEREVKFNDDYSDPV